MRLVKVSKITAAIVLIVGLVSFLAACGNGQRQTAQSTGPTATIGISTNLPYLSMR